MKLLTIAVPAYNVEKTLESTLDSLSIDGLLEVLDVLIINDGSSDRTAEIADSFIRRYPGTFRLVNKLNGGHGSAVNTGIRLASGKYFKVVDGDDRLEEKGLRTLVAYLENADADLVATHYKKVPADGGAPIPMKFENVEFLRVYPFDSLPVDGKLYFGIHSVTYRTGLLQEHSIELQERTFYVDAEYGVLPMPFVKTVVFLDVFTYLYTVGSSAQSIDTSNFVRRYEDHYRVVRRLTGYVSKCKEDRPHSEYIYTVLQKLCFTHYMLAAFYDSDIPRGKQRAREFDAWLAHESPRLYRALGDSRYIAFLRLIHFSFLPRGEKLKKFIKRVNAVFKPFIKRRKFTY